MTSPLQTLELYAVLDDEQRRFFERAAHQVAVSKGEVVIDQGVKSKDVFFAVDGHFEVMVYSENGKDVLYRTIGAGDVFGELAAIDDGLRSASVTAQTKGRLVRMSGDDFRALIERSLGAALWLLRKHTVQIRALTGRLFEQIAYNVSTRIRAELLRLGAAAGVKNGQARIFPVPAHRVLAAKLGTTREAVTRELGDLTEKGLIARDRPREIIILDFEALTRLVQAANDLPDRDRKRK
jgi:CRP/FNR family transcriptional regulator, cyclic AMP receptor protein